MSWKNFNLAEFECLHCGKNEIDPDFVDKLQTLRDACGFPLIITSGYRCPEHNQAVSSTGPDGPHTTGRAVDIHVYGFRAMDFLSKALALKLFTGIGIKQHGNSRFVHLDDLPSPAYPRPTIWSYP